MVATNSAYLFRSVKIKRKEKKRKRTRCAVLVEHHRSVGRMRDERDLQVRELHGEHRGRQIFLALFEQSVAREALFALPRRAGPPGRARCRRGRGARAGERRTRRADPSCPSSLHPSLESSSLEQRSSERGTTTATRRPNLGLVLLLFFLLFRVLGVFRCYLARKNFLLFSIGDVNIIVVVVVRDDDARILL